MVVGLGERDSDERGIEQVVVTGVSRSLVLAQIDLRYAARLTATDAPLHRLGVGRTRPIEHLAPRATL